MLHDLSKLLFLLKILFYCEKHFCFNLDVCQEQQQRIIDALILTKLTNAVNLKSQLYVQKTI